MSITIKDVAQKAQVSVATVSRVLNDTPSVSPELRERVLSAAGALEYRPSPLARSLRTNTTRLLAIVVPDIENPFFIAVARGVEEISFTAGYGLLVCNTNDDPAREASYFQALSDGMIAGAIVCATDERHGQAANKLLSNGIPVVALDRRLDGVAADSILSDNFGGSRLAVSYLIGLGHRRIGLIAGPDRFAPGRERRQGYEQAFSDHDLPLDRNLMVVTDFRPSAAEAATEDLLHLSEPPTAIFISSGNSALGTLRAIHRAGLRIPEDVSIIIFDDLNWEEAYNPPLTAVAQNTRQLGTTAADLLLRRIRGEQEPIQERRLQTKLVIRESCAKLPVRVGG